MQPQHSQPRNGGGTPTVRASRMSLAQITHGRAESPLRVLLYGVEGVGKTTFAAGAPGPVFIGPEDGVPPSLGDVPRFRPPEGAWLWQDVLDCVRSLSDEKHEHRTLVLDTLDWLEPLLWKHICERDGQASIEGYGYGKGYVAALDEWRVFVAALERLRAATGMHVILLAHSWIKPFKNPEGEDFDRYTLKIHDKAGGFLKEWSDAVLFANYETFAQKDAKTKRVRGIDTGARLIYTQRRAAFDAKNRHSLPESLPLSWEDFYAATKTQQTASPEDLRTAIEAKIPKLDSAHGEKATAALERAGTDAVKLAQLNDWVNAWLPKEEA